MRHDIEHLIRHLILDVLSKKNIDKVLRLVRKMDWKDPQVGFCDQLVLITDRC